MLRLFSAVQVLLASCLAIGTYAYAMGARSPSEWIKPYPRAPLQNIVTWDSKSLFVHGKRVFFFSGEFHPFRLPVPSLWLDVFQKIKALGYNGVSFYVDWALLEGNPGHFTAEGVFAFEPFFDAAQEAGIYLLARPGPYINAEASGGGFPGWLQRVNGRLRTSDPAYLNATDNYAANIGRIIAKAQITNGGPVILVQPENEYSGAVNVPDFPQYDYFAYVEKQLRDAGIVVPFISNDAYPHGYDVPGSPAPVDIYGHDGYPVGFDCANPTVWPTGNLPTYYLGLHEQQSPSTPYSIVEFQGGSFDPWGGWGFDQCGILVNEEFERVFYKNDYAQGVVIFNLYMTFGGTNWGNLGHPGGYTSYDYSAGVAEDRTITREKYSEMKLQANFFRAAPAYLVADRFNGTTSLTNNPAITVQPAVASGTRFYFTRHTQYNSFDSTSYKLYVTTPYGNLTVPQLNSSLTLNGRDAKVHVSGFKAGNVNLVYSTAEVFTWKKYSGKTVIIVYGGPGEQHELAVEKAGTVSVVEGSGVTTAQKIGYTILNWATSPTRKVVKVQNNVYIYLLDRNSAYNYWVPPEPEDYGEGNVILKAGYLIRTAEVHGNSLSLSGDLNTTTPIEIIGGAPSKLSTLRFNDKQVDFKQDSETGVVIANLAYTSPKVKAPQLADLNWHYLDTLPELQSTYDDSAWTSATLPKTYNTLRNLTTPTSLYSADYGYHTGALIYRGHFTATGAETTFFVHTQGGWASGSSAWIGNTYLGSVPGVDVNPDANSTYTLPNLTKGQKYVITLVIDTMGYNENWVVGVEEMKNPRGILDYTLAGHDASDISWKLTGNLGGEIYADHIRGPLNEGGLFAERQGYHLPSPPVNSAGWKTVKGGPNVGITKPGIAFYATSFDLDLPDGYDIPVSFVFSNTTATSTSATGNSTSKAAAYRAQLYVNGYQFGKYVHNVGPQDSFPVPQGILDYQGTNWVAVTLWAMETGGAKTDLSLNVGHPVVWDFDVEMSPMSEWKKRSGAY